MENLIQWCERLPDSYFYVLHIAGWVLAVIAFSLREEGWTMAKDGSKVTCPACNGAGGEAFGDAWEECRECRGTGKVPVSDAAPEGEQR